METRRTFPLVCICVALVATAGTTGRAFAQSCSAEPLMLQVLGSGGPYAGGKRASTGYIVWRDGRAAVMIDAGGGTFLRFGEAGARLADLALLGITHLHPDHVSDLPALLWLSEGARQQPLKVAGPTGAGDYPGTDAFLKRLFDSTSGAFPALRGTLGQPGGRGVKLDVSVIDATVGTSSTVLSIGDLEVRAIGVPHGDVPSIGYRIRIGDRSIAFGSDQNGTDPRFAEFASGVDVLVMHLAVARAAAEPLARVHARPTTVGQVARDAKAKRLVLSHFIDAPAGFATPQWFSLSDLPQSLADVRSAYAGPVDAAIDLQCIPIRQARSP